MPKILYLTSGKEESFKLKKYIAIQEPDIEMIEEMSSGTIIPKLMEKYADVLLISDTVLKERTAAFVRTIREGVPWYLQIPIIVVTNTTDMTVQRVKDMYTAGANYVSMGGNTDLEILWYIVKSQDTYTNLLKSNNRMAMRHI
jgi:hypothetical protein